MKNEKYIYSIFITDDGEYYEFGPHIKFNPELRFTGTQFVLDREGFVTSVMEYTNDKYHGRGTTYFKSILQYEGYTVNKNMGMWYEGEHLLYP